MLPPFVPPSARVPSEPLPLITEFVIERTSSAAVAESATATLEPPEAPELPEAPAQPEAPRAWTSDSEVPLPSIEEFMIRRTAADRSGTSAPEPASPGIAAPPELAASAGGEATGAAAAVPEPQPAVAEAQQPSTEVEAALAVTGEDMPAAPASEETPPGAVFNDEAGAVERSTPGVSAADAWSVSSMSAAAAGAESAGREATAEASESVAESATESRPSAAGAPAEEWVADERDAFDWQRVAGLAASPDEARRAAEDWAATSWDRGHRSEQEHVAAALVQIARRIRAGELKVEVPQQATAEASLAAVLAALLADGDR